MQSTTKVQRTVPEDASYTELAQMANCIMFEQ
jgi:hypothetical protein